MKSAAAVCLVILFAVGGLAGGATAAEKLNVVASFSILRDMTQRVGGERVEVHTLVGDEADAHVFQPTPADAKTIARAQLVVINGYGFEGWIERLVKSSGYRGKVVVAAAGVRTLRLAPAPAHARDDAADVDPHAWQDLANALRYVDNIARALGEADPAGATLYQANAQKFKREISALDGEVRAAFAAIPKDRRKVVTAHDAFAYFGRAYDVEFIAPVGVNSDAEPSAREVGRIIRQIRSEHIPAVFLEGLSDPRLLERIQRESGARIGGRLYPDALSKPGGAAASYLEMMRHNATTIVTALRLQ
jgi:zinc/manganese transport system substrate-binding protein